MNKLCFVATSILISQTVLAGTPIEPMQSDPIEVANQTKDQLLKTAHLCVLKTLKNKDSVKPTGMGTIFAESKSTSSDPSVILSETDSSIEARHVFFTTGFITAGNIQADLTLDVKDGKFRYRWHDFRYGVNDQPSNSSEFITEALPYKKAMAVIEQTSTDLKNCITNPTNNSNW